MATNRLITLNRDENKFGIKSIDKTILTSNWIDDTGTSGYWYYDILDGEITSFRKVDVDFALNDLQYTDKILKTSESFEGYVRIYATQQPSSDINSTIVIYFGVNAE